MSNATVKTGKKLAAQKIFKSYEFSLFCALILIFIVSALSHKYFLTVTNVMNIGLAAAVSGTMAAGLTMYMLIGALDMSQYPIAALSTIIMGVANMKWGLNVWASLAICLVIATILGAINGTLLLAALLLGQSACVGLTRGNKAIHDLLAGTVCVDYHSQMIFESSEALLEHKKKLAAQRAAEATY